MIVADLPPEGGGADAELLCGELAVAMIFSEAGHEKIAVDVVALRDVRKERRWGGRFRVYGGFGCVRP